MADLTGILSGWRPDATKIIDSPGLQMRQQMIGAGITPPDHIYGDGKLHRFNSGSKGPSKTDKPGYYVLYSDGVPSGHFGDWRTGVSLNFRADVGRKLSPAEEMAITRRMAEAKAAREHELAKSQESAADTVGIIWADGIAASADHPYLERKGIQAHGARITGDGRIMVPLFNADGEISSIQYISADGEKRYHPGGATKGCFWILGTDTSKIYIAEGYATAATIHQVTGKMVAIAYSAGNLPATAEAIRALYPSAEMIVVADNDASGTGLNYADQAVAKTGARLVIPPEQGDANDYFQAGGDLSALLEPAIDDWLVRADDFCLQPAPISWHIKHWLQEQALIMVHGPSGGGKTFIVLNWLLLMASGHTSWGDHKVKAGNVVYLAGEGHHGLRARVAAWKDKNSAGKLDMWLSRSGCDLNTPEGYQRVVSHIRALNEKPDIIAVDTLHRFLSGDENSAQDAKTMLDACAGLMAEFGCSVLLVHHTGVSDEAQHRARGSSAWRGALDIEISVVPAKDGKPMEIVQRKSKDAEMAEAMYCTLESHVIPGWLDEDGEPVTSAVATIAEAPDKPDKKASKTQEIIKLFERAWQHGGMEVQDGKPYVTRSAFRDFLMVNLACSEKAAKNKMEASREGSPINYLMMGSIIDRHAHGWVMLDEAQISAFMLQKTGP